MGVKAMRKQHIRLSGKAHQVFTYWRCIIKAYGNITLAELQAKNGR
jgi:hypothetical protein